MSEISAELDQWMGLIQRVCFNLGVASPTAKEWDDLILAWHPGKSVLSAIRELELQRFSA